MIQNSDANWTYHPLLPALKPVAWCWACSPVVMTLVLFIDLSMISSQKTPCGMGKHWDPIFAVMLSLGITLVHHLLDDEI
jgi:hypothetical protein